MTKTTRFTLFQTSPGYDFLGAAKEALDYKAGPDEKVMFNFGGINVETTGIDSIPELQKAYDRAKESHRRMYGIQSERHSP
jgi:hypothetical protein